ncbi:iron-sulfur cluster assembly scaffold protein [Actinomycetota bacterium]|nr:iron-sulfur cluster assembly scaffold protein [Actinomycetota bacterium]
MDDLEMMYQEVILEESRNPYHKLYEIEDPNRSHQFNPTCGDDITVAVTIDDDIVSGVNFAGEGCSISIASTSIMAQLVEGKTTEQVFELADLFTELMNSRGAGLDDDKLDKLGDASVFVGTSKFPARIKCALLGWVALKGALTNQGVSSAQNKHTE